MCSFYVCFLCLRQGLRWPPIHRVVKTEKFGRQKQTEKTDTGSLRSYVLAFRNLCKEKDREGVGQGYLMGQQGEGEGPETSKTHKLVPLSRLEP